MTQHYLVALVNEDTEESYMLEYDVDSFTEALDKAKLYIRVNADG